MVTQFFLSDIPGPGFNSKFIFKDRLLLKQFPIWDFSTSSSPKSCRSSKIASDPLNHCCHNRTDIENWASLDVVLLAFLPVDLALIHLPSLVPLCFTLVCTAGEIWFHQIHVQQLLLDLRGHWVSNSKCIAKICLKKLKCTIPSSLWSHSCIVCVGIDLTLIASFCLK